MRGSAHSGNQISNAYARHQHLAPRMATSRWRALRAAALVRAFRTRAVKGINRLPEYKRGALSHQRQRKTSVMSAA